ncbi:MAG: hypothetical protein J0H92_14210 [Sphingobacteriales bacterium]|jgi:hypothetical protein|nr:hypothetical protein [Sphingobacteriales bacterium]
MKWRLFIFLFFFNLLLLSSCGVVEKAIQAEAGWPLLMLGGILFVLPWVIVRCRA